MDQIHELYQQLILDHNRNPKNFKKLESANRQCEGFNPLCGDRVVVYLNIKNDMVQDISFEGSGCAISKASASIMTTILKLLKAKNQIQKKEERRLKRLRMK